METTLMTDDKETSGWPVWRTVGEAGRCGQAYGAIGIRIQIMHSKEISDLNSIKNRIELDSALQSVLNVCAEELVLANKQWCESLNSLRAEVLNLLQDLYGVYKWIKNRKDSNSTSVANPSLQLSTRIGVVYLTYTSGLFLIDWSDSMANMDAVDIFPKKKFRTREEGESKIYIVDKIEELRDIFSSIVNHEIQYLDHQLNYTKV